jgi:sugar phosphate isomerase/epimerase
MSIQIALQLFTVREEAAKDYIGTLEKVAQIGYKGVEFAGYGDLPASEIRKCLDRTGLKAVASHVRIEILKENLDAAIDYSLEIGNKYIICPRANGESREDYLNHAKYFNEVGEKCRKKGIAFGYHNHAHEFVKYGEEYAFDTIFGNTDPELVKVELDAYWAKFAGVDPLEFLKKYSGRYSTVHVKDMEPGEEKAITEVGSGIMDVKGIVKAAEAGGAQWVVAEIDRSRLTPMDRARVSFDNLIKMNIV